MKIVLKRVAVMMVFLIFSAGNGVILFAQLDENKHFSISKHLDIFHTLFNELNLYYVDTLNVENVIQNDIFYMLQQLDPYTEYIPEKDMSDFQFQTTGEYAGIGAVITTKNRRVVVVEPWEGMPADLSGLIPGDEIVAIDGENVEAKSTDYVSVRLKGQPDTDVKIKYRRQGENRLRGITIQRKRVHLNPVTYYGVLKDGIGYLHLSGFTAQSAWAVKEALLDLTQNHHIQSLVFDVRDNGGGVVEDCLEMLNFFLPKGELLLSMRGKVKQLDRTYRATQSPIEPDLPLAILVNGNSASASEILSGTVQDLDRGIVIGTRTFGKGLVQTTHSLPYNGKLKLTTSKYYIPSGRSIQAVDYANRDEEGRATSIPDSLTKVYYTSRNRPVRDGGGILPDFVVEDEKTPTLVYYLEAHFLFFDFVSQWRVKHPQIASPSDFVLTDDIYNEFKEFVKSKDFSYDRQSEKTMEALKKIMQYEGYFDAASAEFQALADKLKPDLNRDLEFHKTPIARFLTMQIMKQYYYEKGRCIYGLRNDSVLNKAVEILRDKSLYDSILSGN